MPHKGYLGKYPSIFIRFCSNVQEMNKIVFHFWKRLFFCQKVDLSVPTAQPEIAKNSPKKQNFSFLASLQIHQA